jgi:hypothetical protein
MVFVVVPTQGQQQSTILRREVEKIMAYHTEAYP